MLLASAILKSGLGGDGHGGRRSAEEVGDVAPQTAHDLLVGVVGARTVRRSCGLLIFVEEAAEAIESLDLGDLGGRAVGEWS